MNHSFEEDSAPTDMNEFWDCLEGELAEAICKVRPTESQWQTFPELLSASLSRTLAEFPGVQRGSLGIAFAEPKNSPIDDALREARAMFSIALEQSGLSKEAVKLFLDWVDFRTEARTVQYQIAVKRLKLDAKTS